MAGDVVWLDVLPSMDKFGRELKSGTEKAAASAGTGAGKAWSKSFESTESGAASQRAEALEKAARKAEDTVKREAANIGKARASEKDAAAKVIVAEEALAKAVAAGGEDSAKAQAAALKLEAARERHEVAAKNVEGQEVKLKSAIEEQKIAAQEAAEATYELGDETEKAGDKTEDASGKWDKFKDVLKVGAVAAAAAVTAVVGLGVGLYNVGSVFDDVEDTIRIGTGATGEALEGLVDSAKLVGTRVPNEFEEIGSTVADVNTRLGLTGDVLETVAAQVLQAGNIMGEAVDVQKTTAAFSAFKIEGDAVVGAMDTLFQISQATGVGMNELADSVAKQGPALQNLGFSYEETAALVGQLDKNGIDTNATLAAMSKGLVTLAKDGEEPQEAFRRITDEVQSLVDKGEVASAIDLASGVFGTRAASTFVGAVQSGTMALDDLVGAAGLSGDTILGVADDTADFAEQWAMFKNEVLVALEPVASRVFSLIGDAMTWIRETGIPIAQDFSAWMGEKLGPAIESVSDWLEGSLVPAVKDFAGWVADDAVPAMQAFGGWVVDNKDWILALAVGIGSVAAAFGVWKGAIAAWELATKAGTAVQVAFNAVMSANPIMIVVLAVAALVAGLVYFFTQTETGQKIWEKFTGALASAWDWTVEKVTAGWEAVQAGLKAGWDWIDSKVFTPVKKGFGFVSDKADALKRGVVGAWDGMKSGLKTGWDWIDSKVMSPVKAGFGFVSDKVTVTKNLALAAWDLFKSGLKSGWDWIDDKVFSPLKKGTDKIGDAFEAAVDVVKGAWNKIGNVVRTPVNWVLDKAWNNGVVSVFNKVAGAVGVKTRLSEAKLIPAFAEGGKTGTGWALVGEEGPELIDLKTPGRVYTAAETAKALASGRDLTRAEADAAAGSSPAQALAPVGGWLSDVKDTVTSAVGSALAWVRGGLATAAKVILDPVKSALAGAVGDHMFGQVVAGAGGSAIDSLVDWIRGKDSESVSARRVSWRRPSRGPVTSYFGSRWGGVHNGLDFGGNLPVFAAADGTVVATGNAVGYGNTGLGVRLSHGGGLESYYGHADPGEIRVRPGQAVTAGQWISMGGNTGNSTGQHLHFSIFENRKAIDPAPFVFDAGGVLLPGRPAVNLSGKPEAVLTNQQWGTLRAAADGGGVAEFNLFDADGELIGRMRGEAVDVVKVASKQVARAKRRVGGGV